ncbi:signal peptidase I [Marininema halotolerans]|uniref:Signal peptidase I n=1 Tax=Marininema halotolerans TaxID=1155944 RepID=A0A1I6TCV3_9BACL|nr:signal peptidase I [Marininema halotolerans]SFS87044.1 signal peptidase I [Marininema halotolerans]
MGKKEKNSAREWIIAVVVAAALVLIIRSFLYAPYEVYGQSMEPTFKGSELLIINKWIYDVENPQYGDIIVFHTSEQRDFIKRVIGKEGDRIQVRDGKVYRNGKALKETYLNEKMIEKSLPVTVVPKDHVFAMGDNRNRSRDSREIGPIAINEIAGRADVQLMPLKEMKLLFP